MTGLSVETTQWKGRTPMDLTANAKSAIAFAITVAVLMAYDVASFQANSETWGPAAGMLEDLSDLIVGLVNPLFLVLSGAAVAGMWQGLRWGFILAMILGAAAVVVNLAFGISFAVNEEFVAAGICVFVIIGGALALWFALKGHGELATS